MATLVKQWGLAMLPCRHVYLPYAEAAHRDNIVVDGAATDRSVLTLSHWPKSGTPWPLKANTSVGIVFNYLDDPVWHRDVPAVTNNHFDEDGLIGIYCLVEPEHALARRALLLDAASAGDFSVCRSREAARLAFSISRLANQKLSPWGAGSFPQDYDDYCTFVFTRLLGQLRGLIDDIEGHRALWADEDALLDASERAIAAGDVTIEERAEIDLAIVRVPADWPDRPAHRFAQHVDVPIHPMAVHNRTACNRVATLCGDRIDFSFRYESWVQMVSHRPPPRIDLSPLAAALSEAEGASWHFDGVAEITPALRSERIHSTLSHERFLEALADALRNGTAAWDPYDRKA